MFTPKHATLAASLLLVIMASASLAETPNFGKPIDEAAIGNWDISILPDGTGLPKGSGTPAQGAPIYAEKCSACHGDNGKGAQAAALVDNRPKHRDRRYLRVAENHQGFLAVFNDGL